jgi:hypothetical protein
MKPMLILLGASAVMAWSALTGFLMTRIPDRFNGEVWWPRLGKATSNPKGSTSRKKIQVLGVLLSIASGVFLFGLIVPAIAGLCLKLFVER